MKLLEFKGGKLKHIFHKFLYIYYIIIDIAHIVLHVRYKYLISRFKGIQSDQRKVKRVKCIWTKRLLQICLKR